MTEEIIEYNGLEYKRVKIREAIKRFAVFRNSHGTIHPIKHEKTIGKTAGQFYHRNFYNLVLLDINNIIEYKFDINNLYNEGD